MPTENSFEESIDRHNAYHVHGMKDPGCGSCARTYIDERANVEIHDGTGCVDCGMAYSLYFNCQFHVSDCPQAGPRQNERFPHRQDSYREPMHLFAQPYNEWLSLCGQTIPSGGATIEVYPYRRSEYCTDCLNVY